MATNDDQLIECIRSGGEVKQWYNHMSPNCELVCSKENYETATSILRTEGCRGLHYAAFFGRVETVRTLLDMGADPSLKAEGGENVLHTALDSSSGDEVTKQMAELLLDKKYRKVRDNFRDIIECECVGFTPLLAAINSNLKETAEFLLESGADPLPERSEPNINIHSLCLAAQANVDILRMLLEHDKIKDQLPGLLNQLYGDRGPLHHAIMYSHVECVKLLVEKKADTKLKDKDDNLPIHYITQATSKDEFKEMALILKDSVDEKDSGELTILHRAVLLNKVEFVEVLVSDEIKADYKIKDDLGRLPIHYLSQSRGNQHLVHRLTDKHSFKAPDNERWTPLHFAVKESHHLLVRELLGAKGRSLHSDKLCVEGQTGVHLAVLVLKGNDTDFRNVLSEFKAGMGKKKFKDQLINKEVEKGVKNKGKTALHLAIQEKKFSRAKILMEEFDADPSKLDGEGKNSLHYAFEHGAPNYLFEKMKDRSGEWEALQEVRGKDQMIPLQCMNSKTPLEAVRLMTRINLTYCSIADSDKLQSPLVIANNKKRNDIVKLLLVKGAVVETRTLRHALVHDNEKLAQILVRHADKDNLVNILNEVISTPNYGKEKSEARRLEAGHPGAEPQASRAYWRSKAHKKRKGPTTVFRELIYRMPDVAMEALHRFVSVDHTPGSEGVTFDYCSINPPCVYNVETGDEERDGFSMRQGRTNEDIALVDPLIMMVESKEKALLQHPLVCSYLHLKWNAYGLGCYIFNFFMYFLFVISLSVFAVTVNNPLGTNCSTSNFIASYTSAFIVVNLAFYHLVVDVLIGWRIGWRYFINCFNCLKCLKFLMFGARIILYFMSGSFVWIFHHDCGCPSEQQWQIGIVAVCFGWIKLVFFAYNLPWTAVYVIMFKKIVYTFFKLIPFATLLSVAFAFILFMMFHNPIEMTGLASFQDFWYTLFTTINFIAGGIGFHTIFGLGSTTEEFRSRDIPYRVTNIFMWILFFFFFVIVFKNLLIGLAIKDVSEISQEAELRKLKLQVRVFDKAELVLPTCVAKEFLRDVPKTYKIEFKKEKLVKRCISKVSFIVWGGQDYLENLEDDEYEQKRQKERVEIESGGVDGIERDLSEMKERIEEIYNFLQTLTSFATTR